MSKCKSKERGSDKRPRQRNHDDRANGDSETKTNDRARIECSTEQRDRGTLLIVNSQSAHLARYPWKVKRAIVDFKPPKSGSSSAKD